MFDYVFKFGTYIIPTSYIAEGGYDCKPNQRQDLDPFTDQFGVTHRNALQHTKTDISLTIRSLSWTDFSTLISKFIGLTVFVYRKLERLRVFFKL